MSEFAITRYWLFFAVLDTSISWHVPGTVDSSGNQHLSAEVHSIRSTASRLLYILDYLN